MKKLLLASLIACSSFAQANDIIISKKVNNKLADAINKDLAYLTTIKFETNTDKRVLNVMDLNTLTGKTANLWLNQRVNYVIEENALSVFKLLIKRVIYVERDNVTYPNHNVLPFGMEKNNLTALPHDLVNDDEGAVVMSNTGAALYMAGKTEGKQFGMKVSKGLLKKSYNVSITSPRTGIIQIGEALFDPRYSVNKNNTNAIANSIDRLSTFFHEARHSDGNGKSLAFAHVKCPKGHDMEGAYACDANLNGPYTVGAMMQNEMLKTCGTSCSEKDKEISKIKILDSFNRVLKIDSKGNATTDWDASPESL